jgi:hypothetical protein|tara:strand:+ start:762 stop:989 length:228 start_codon:yes stop_codon:yes gene_type:complete
VEDFTRNLEFSDANNKTSREFGFESNSFRRSLLKGKQSVSSQDSIGTSKQPEEQEIMSNIPSNTARIEINPVTYL